jgi:membrane glycosyltransferase
MRRRIFLVFVLVVMRNLPFFQTLFILNVSLSSMHYITNHRPFDDDNVNYMEIFNETCVFICSHVVCAFLNPSLHHYFIVLMGWVLIGVALINLLINLAVVGI